MSVNYVALGKRIGYFRMQCGNITQEALASKINRSREFLAKIEKGTEHLSVATLVDIADALTASRVLCAFGAEVIKVETKIGDEMRRAGEFEMVVCEDDKNPLFTLTWESLFRC